MLDDVSPRDNRDQDHAQRDRKNLTSLYRKFQPLKRKNAAIENLPRGTFLSPKLVAQISYTELTKDGKLRHPVFLGLRDDKDPKDVSLPQT